MGVVDNPVRQALGSGYHTALETESYQYQNNDMLAEYYIPLG